MSNPIVLQIPMRPFAKQRPRFNKSGKAYMDANYKARKDMLGWLFKAQEQAPKHPLTGNLMVVVELAFKGKGPRADADNLAGGVLDSLNGLLWVDDSQIVNLQTVVSRNAATDSIGLIVRQLPV